jgi:AcrR family transcriptional regulator
MVRGVNARSGDVRARRVALTEERLIRSASRLFVRDGYAATTLVAVAEDAGVAPRTVYLRFGTKAALLKRAIDVALVGDTEPIDVASREWFQESVTAPTLEQRVTAGVIGASEMMRRVGPLIAVAGQAEATEPVIADAAQAGREATRDALRRFWTSAADAGLLDPGADLDWLADTAALVGAAETYLLATRTLGWTPDEYQRWLYQTWHRLALAAAHPAGSGASRARPAP